jgi:flagellar motility protein MotE (MotC chaperone)
VKKIFVIGGAFFLLILVVKIILFAGAFLGTKEGGRAAGPASVSAQTPAPAPARPAGEGTPPPGPVSPAPKDPLAQERTLLGALTAKKKEIEERESRLKVEEERLAAVRKEIAATLEAERGRAEKIGAMVERIQSFETKAIRDLARVYETTPPARAGQMLERLDTKTAAGITLNMKRDRAGAVWAFISPQKAVDITREITSIRVPNAPPGPEPPPRR